MAIGSRKIVETAVKSMVRTEEIRPLIRSATIGFAGQRTKTKPHRLSADGANRNWLRGQDLNLRPSGYEQPRGTSQPVTATDKPSQSLQDGQEDLADPLQALPTLPKDFGPPVVRTSMSDPSRSGSLLTVKQVAARLGVSAATVYGLCERRELHHVRIANAIRVSRDALQAFLHAASAVPSKRQATTQASSENPDATAASPPTSAP